jgi:hypothetical protein
VTGTAVSNGSSPLTLLYFNGQSVGSVSSDETNGGWDAFFALFSGKISSLQGWTAGGATTLAPDTSGMTTTGTLVKIQGWSHGTTSPVTKTTTTSLASVQPQGSIKPKPAGTIGPMKRAWNSGFVGHRRHR